MGRAWAIKETFQNLWSYTYQKSAEKFFDKWCWGARPSRLDPIIKVAKLLKRHLENILNYPGHRFTRASAEDFHPKMQAIKAAARGFRTSQTTRRPSAFIVANLIFSPPKVERSKKEKKT